MIYCKLGRTGIDVSVIGLGTEYLNRKPRETVVSIVHEAIDKGVNYFDVVFAFPEYRDNMSAAFRGKREKIVLCGHICCAYTKNQYRLSRDVQENERLFNDLLKRLHTDYVDIIMIQMVNEMVSYDNITMPGGIMEFAYRIKKHGMARFIGVSGHKVPAVTKAFENKAIDVVMFPINIAWDFVPGRKEIFETCSKNNIGLVAMKIYGGGRLFQKHGNETITPVKCINYALSQPAVSTVVPGVKNIRQLNEALNYLNSTEKEKNFKDILKECRQELNGNCVYCNHCLPCPAGIDIGSVINEVDRALTKVQRQKDKKAMINFYYPGRIRLSRDNFKGLSIKASKCTECGICMKRCPFGVNVIEKMKQAMRLQNVAVRFIAQKYGG